MILINEKLLETLDFVKNPKQNQYPFLVKFSMILIRSMSKGKIKSMKKFGWNYIGILGIA